MRLALKIEGPVASEAAYRAVAERWGRAVVLEDGLSSAQVRIDFEQMTFDEVVEILATSLRHLPVRADDGATRIVDDTPLNRAGLQPVLEHRLQVERAEVSEAATALRTLVRIGKIFTEPEQGGLRVLIPRWVIPHAELVTGWMDGGGAPGPSFHWPGSAAEMKIEPQKLVATDWRRRRLWYPRPTRDLVYRGIEELWGVDLVADPRYLGGQLVYPPVPSEMTLFEALDALTLPAGLQWTLAGDRRVLISERTPANRRLYEPEGFARFPLEAVDPRTVRQALGDLGIHLAAAGSRPAVVLVRGDAMRLWMARFVIDRLEEAASGRGSPRPRVLWLGSEAWWRTADARRALLSTTGAAERLELEAGRPPPLAPGPLPPEDVRATPRNLRRALWEDLGLVAALDICGSAARGAGTLGASGSDRAVALEQVARSLGLIWTAVGPDTVLMAPDRPACRRRLEPQALFAIQTHVGVKLARVRLQRLGLEPQAEFLADGWAVSFVRGSLGALGRLATEVESVLERPDGR